MASDAEVLVLKRRGPRLIARFGTPYVSPCGVPLFLREGESTVGAELLSPS